MQWKNETRLAKVSRFDPNENIASIAMHQEFDWIRLTKLDSITQGGLFPIKVNLNKPANGLRSLTYYYTSDVNRPTQYPAQIVQPSSQLPSAPFHVYLPNILTYSLDAFVGGLKADVTAYWNTAKVTPGEYYVCATADDGYNQSTYCSDAPMDVLAP